jgi:hypothetical protein
MQQGLSNNAGADSAGWGELMNEFGAGILGSRNASDTVSGEIDTREVPEDGFRKSIFSNATDTPEWFSGSVLFPLFLNWLVMSRVVRQMASMHAMLLRAWCGVRFQSAFIHPRVHRNNSPWKLAAARCNRLPSMEKMSAGFTLVVHLS